MVTAGELLEGYLGSAQLWKSATVASHYRVVWALAGDPLCRCRLQWLTPAVMRAAICRWRDEGVSVPKVSARWLLIRSEVQAWRHRGNDGVAGGAGLAAGQAVAARRRACRAMSAGVSPGW